MTGVEFFAAIGTGFVVMILAMSVMAIRESILKYNQRKRPRKS